MPASMDGNVSRKRLGNYHDEGTKKTQRRDESPGSDIWDDRELEKIVPIDGTTQVITIGNLLFGAAQIGRSNLAEAVLGLRGLPHTTWMDERMATILDVVVTSVVAMLCTISSRLHLSLDFALTQATITNGSWTRPAINESVGSDLGAAQEQSIYIPFQNYIDQNEADPNATQETRLDIYRS
ncbi:hypothetical protein VE04_08033 [Pseudogymnoascus sp. 24MN13]|nr:hypothetical protein VE04_08033 [Pseudogymnoascus sp. 24MN13]